MVFSVRATWIAAVAWAAGFGAMAVLGASCIENDPRHCRHKLGDASCSGSTPYCDKCLSSEQNGGCVAEEPSDACYFAGDDPFDASTGSTSVGSTGSGDEVADTGEGSTGPGGDCTVDNAPDATCAAQTPYCVGGVCSGCPDAVFCEGAAPAEPYCGAQGLCVACSDDEHCGGGTPFCGLNGVCSGCFEHSQCGEAGCDIFEGVCLGDTVFWVNAAQAGIGEGTEAVPYSSFESIQALFDDFDFDEITVRVVGSAPYSHALSLGGGEVAVLIAHDGQPRLGSTRAVQVSGARVYVDGFALEADGEGIMSCNGGGKIWLHRADVRRNLTGWGISVLQGCEVMVERSIIHDNFGGGILAIDSDVILRSSAVLGNGNDRAATTGIRIEGTGSLTASHLTLIANEGTDFRQLECIGDGSATIRNSILGGTEIAQSAYGCSALTLADSAADENLEDLENGVVRVVYDGSDFADPINDPRLEGSGAKFSDVARWTAGDPRVDLDDEAWETLPGDRNFAGCHRP